MSSLSKHIPDSFRTPYRWLRALLANMQYGFPARKMVVIGVTGTDGKTTTSHMVATVLRAAGHNVGLSTTVSFAIGEKSWTNTSKMTSLPPMLLQKFLRQCLDAGCTHVVVETSSHALQQLRVWGIPYDVAVITNVTHEHLDYHKTLEQYFSAKAKLFKLLRSKHKNNTPKIAVTNLDNEFTRRLTTTKADKVYGYTIAGATTSDATTVSARDIAVSLSGTAFTAVFPQQHIPVQVQLLGKVYAANALAALCVADGLGIDLAVAANALAQMPPVPGRMERVEAGQPFTVLIDYAVTPAALMLLYKDTLPLLTKGRILAVMGACGDRDQEKRPIMGEIVGTYAHKVFLTHEDSWTEDPDSIVRMIEPGLTKAGKQKLALDARGVDGYTVIMDRRAAIAAALAEAKPGDVVVVTGKGAETKMVYPGKSLPWSERDVLREEIARLHN